MISRDDVRTLLARRKSGHTLEAPFYTSREIYDLDLALIFGRHWICVGVEPDVPEPGDFFTVDLGSESVIVVRDDDLSIRAFHNVCRHRGARLCMEEKGVVGNVVCPYHQWTYNLRGDLIHCEHMGEGFDNSRYGLAPVHVRSLGGILFICLAAAPPDDFATMQAAMTPYLAPHGIADCKIVKQIDLIEEGNWKLVMDNNRECYHCRVNHPELTASLYEYGFGFQPTDANRARLQEFEQRLAQEHGRWEALGLPSAEIERLSECTGFRAVRLPLDRHGESQTLDTKVASRRLLGDLSQRDLGGLSFWTQPNSWHHLMSDHVVTFAVLPLSPDRTLLRTKWLVHKDAREGVDYDLANLIAVWEATNQQDKRLVGLCQRGAETSGYRPGPYSPHAENLVEKFAAWYVRRMTAALA